MTHNRIAVVNFASSDSATGTQDYEYLAPDYVPEDATHVVVTNRGGNSMKVLKVKAWKDLLDKDFYGELVPVIAGFSIAHWEDAKKRQKRKANLEKAIHAKLEDLGILAKIKALGLDTDPEINKLVEEYKNL